jgi:large subunit ribosomal protein L25
MHEKAPILDAKPREKVGTRYTRRVREQGGLPAIVYGHKENPVAVAVNAHDALAHINKGEKVFRLQMDGKGEPQIVLLKEVQFDHLGTHIVHADFARVSLTDRVTVRVPVHLIGEAKGLKTAGAILMHPTNEIEVECLVTEIPDFVEVNIAELDVDHAITAGEVKLPTASMKLKTDKHAKVAQIVIQQEIVEVKPEEAAVEAGPTEPEVITAKKKEEEGAEGEAAKPGAKPAAGAAAKPAAGAAAKGAAPAKEEKKK